MGFQISAKEALLKQIRGLQGTSWKNDSAAFHTYAKASLQLCQLHLDMASSSQGNAQSLASARMHLRTTLKQAAESHSGDALYQRMQELLTQVEALEAEQRQAAKS